MHPRAKASVLLTFVATVSSCGAPDRNALPPTVHRDETVRIPGTDVSFQMAAIPATGSLRSFSISKHEVTWGQFDRFYEFPEEIETDGVTRPSAGKNYIGLSGYPPHFLEADRPVTGLRYFSVLVYCEWLSRKTGHIFRLPTEKEWAVACGPTPPRLDVHAWSAANSGDRTHAVGRTKANAHGIYDMLGNAWEYCLEPDRPPDYGPVLRGGSWITPPAGVNSEARLTEQPAWFQADPVRPLSTWWFRAEFHQGFRVVRVPSRARPEERKAYARKIRIADVNGRARIFKIGRSTFFFNRVAGTVANEGDRPLVELALKVYALMPDGKPHVEDLSTPANRRATFGVCYPALVNSAHPGPHARTLAPGERRSFSVDFPMPFDGPEDVREGAFGAEVLHLRFGP